MLPEQSNEIALFPESDILPIIVIGAGPVGVRVVLELCRQLPECRIHLFSGEPWTAQKRIKPNSFLVTESDQAELSQNTGLTDSSQVITHFNEYVVGIDRINRAITTRYGNRYGYRHLILATGSKPNVPQIPGIGLEGVYTYRDMTDTQRLYAGMTRSRHTLVIGGGLLGLEAAKAMRRFNTRVTVIEHSSHLLFQQLDTRGAQMLRRHVEALGIRVYTNESIKQILGSLIVQGVQLRSGNIIKCDTIILAAGVQPNIELASESGLAIGRGILVNDRLQTSDTLIYAVGECVEHRGVIYGLAAPGYEQAYVVACAIADRPGCYTGSVSVTSLKVAGYPIFSMGEVRESDWQGDDPVYLDQAHGIYRKLIIERDRLIGVIALGDWSEIPRLRETVYNRRRLMPWHVWRFRRYGRLWREAGSLDFLSWPASATICNCTGISLARLQRELDMGASSVAELTAATGAGSVCGACKPLLGNLVGGAQAQTAGGWRSLSGISLVIALLVLLFLLPVKLPYNTSVQDALQWDGLWRDPLQKQITGFGLLGSGLMLALLGLRKRLSVFRWGSFERWRLLHVILGLATTAILLLHTGLRLGQELNLLLMLSFIGLLLSGSALGCLYGFEHRLPAGWLSRTRRLSHWCHVLLLWPLPLLLGLHVAKTYYF